MRIAVGRPFAAFLLLIANAAASAQEAEPPRPLRIDTVVLAASGGEFVGFSEPATCEAGFVVFHARKKGGGAALLTSSGGPAQPLLATGTTLRTADASFALESIGELPSVNDENQVAFRASFADGLAAIVVADAFARRFEFVANSTEAFREFGPQVEINRAGEVAFHATIDPPGHPDRDDGLKPANEEDALHAPDRLPPPMRLTYGGRQPSFEAGLFSERGGKLRVVARSGALLLDVQDGFALNSAGALAYRACGQVAHWSVRLDAGAFAQSLATTRGEPAERYGPPTLNDSGECAFVTWGADGATAIYRGGAGRSQPQVAIDGSAGFSAIDAGIAIDGAGRVAFVGHRKDGGTALCVGPDALHITELLPVGAPLAGSRVGAIRLGGRAFARSSRLALLVQLEDGREAVVLLYARR